ncbi:MAG: pyrroline-5-carboxylate reductase dimerization domain-containing protein [Amaricoccus sp.]
MRLGIVGGNGWIGGAIARAVVEGGIVAAKDLTLSCRRDPPEWLPDAHWTGDNQALADRSEVILVAVRPQDWPSVRLAAGGRLVVSVMAGPTIAAIAAATGTERVVRALPNAAAAVGASYTPWIASPAAEAGDRAIVRRILAGVGTEDEVGSEDVVDYLTGLSGTGPAYPALLAVAMMRDAVARGLPPAVARRAVVGLLVGTGRLFERTGEDPAETVAAFVEYRGVTAAAIEAMRAAGFEDAVAAGLAAALAKARTLASFG